MAAQKARTDTRAVDSAAVERASVHAVCDVAIVIVSYNTVQLLRDCLASLTAARAQSRADLRVQVCVVDNASTDGSVEMVRGEFPDVDCLVNSANQGFSAANNIGLRRLGFSDTPGSRPEAPETTDLARYALLLNSDTVVPPGAIEAMVQFMDENPAIGVAGPRLRRLDGSLDPACRRSFPTPQVSFYRMVGLSRLFPKSRRFSAYNMAYHAEDAVHPVDSVTGAFMLLRREAVMQVGLLDQTFFMYGEDLDWAKRIKDAGWEVWYNGQVEVTHIKEASSRQSSKSRIDFYEAMWIFYQKHYRRETNWWLHRSIRLAIVCKGALDVASHLWAFCRDGGGPGGQTIAHVDAPVHAGKGQETPDAGSLQRPADHSPAQSAALSVKTDGS